MRAVWAWLVVACVAVAACGDEHELEAGHSLADIRGGKGQDKLDGVSDPDDLEPPADAGEPAPADAGAQLPDDAGAQRLGDAAAIPRGDAGPQLPADAGPSAHGDAGTSSASDAGAAAPVVVAPPAPRTWFDGRKMRIYFAGSGHGLDQQIVFRVHEGGEIATVERTDLLPAVPAPMPNAIATLRGPGVWQWSYGHELCELRLDDERKILLGATCSIEYETKTHGWLFDRGSATVQLLKG